MKISHSWLRTLCPHADDAESVAEKLTSAGLEIEEVAPVAAPLDGVVVARILSAEQHPNADRLRVCQVDLGSEEKLQIVCGAPNARAGLVTALATIGTRLPGGLHIRKGKLRGEVSMGMLCAAAELGLDGADGIIELPEDLSPGQSIVEALDLNDSIFDIALTPNRGDCLSATGIARELNALGVGLAQPVETKAPEPTHTAQRHITIESHADCRSYFGQIIRDVDGTVSTPLWMVERLRRSGIRSKGPLVDITNYVMLELGQPMHAFDNEKLSGDIGVRRAQSGESLTLLNEQSVELSEEDLLITDENGPLALAGAMGGLASSVTSDTKTLFLESACFAASAVAGLGRRHKITSDSLHRYERATDPLLPPKALSRAAQLITDICGGSAGPVTHAGEAVHDADPVTLDIKRCNAILGTNIDTETATEVFQRLGFAIQPSGPEQLKVTPPSWRHDIAIAEDLMEEVARIVGYDNLGGTPSRVDPAYFAPQIDVRISTLLRDALVNRGWSEVVSYSFTSASLNSALSAKHASTITLANPISDQLTTMRSSLWASMVPVYQHNVRQSNRDLRLFEVGRQFRKNTDGRIEEHNVIAGICGGHAEPENWNQQPRRAIDFYDLSGLVDDLIESLSPHVECAREAGDHPALHPGKCARILVGGKFAGWVGQLHPGAWKSTGGSGKAPFVFELHLATLGEAKQNAIADIPPFPASRRDLSFLVPSNTSAQELMQFIRQNSTAPLTELRVFDVFSDDSLQEGFKSIAFGLIFQDFSRTLDDGVIDAAIAALVDGLTQTFRAKLRD